MSFQIENGLLIKYHPENSETDVGSEKTLCEQEQYSVRNEKKESDEK